MAREHKDNYLEVLINCSYENVYGSEWADEDVDVDEMMDALEVTASGFGLGEEDEARLYELFEAGLKKG